MTLRTNLTQNIYNVVMLRKNDSHIKPARYGAYAHRLPLLIRTAGLAQALAYVAARGKAEGEALIADIEHVLGVQPGQLLIRSRETDLMQYMRLTQRTMTALLWFKRFAQTVLKVEPTAEPEED
jgi:CRISPR-associated protein Cmr5